MKMDFLTKLEALKKNKPDLYAELTSNSANVSNSKSVKHESKLSVPASTPIQISLKEAKRILKENRPPRKPISDEQRARMIANLQRGRETLRKRRESLKSPAPNTEVQVKSKQARQVKPAPSVDPDYEEFLNIKRQQEALSRMQKQRQSKYSAL